MGYVSLPKGIKPLVLFSEGSLDGGVAELFFFLPISSLVGGHVDNHIGGVSCNKRTCTPNNLAMLSRDFHHPAACIFGCNYTFLNNTNIRKEENKIHIQILSHNFISLHMSVFVASLSSILVLFHRPKEGPFKSKQGSSKGHNYIVY